VHHGDLVRWLDVFASSQVRHNAPVKQQNQPVMIIRFSVQDGGFEGKTPDIELFETFFQLPRLMIGNGT
jgi:hypothetical protein